MIRSLQIMLTVTCSGAADEEAQGGTEIESVIDWPWQVEQICCPAEKNIELKIIITNNNKNNIDTFLNIVIVSIIVILFDPNIIFSLSNTFLAAWCLWVTSKQP